MVISNQQISVWNGLPLRVVGAKTWSLTSSEEGPCDVVSCDSSRLDSRTQDIPVSLMFLNSYSLTGQYVTRSFLLCSTSGTNAKVSIKGSFPV